MYQQSGQPYPMPQQRGGYYPQNYPAFYQPMSMQQAQQASIPGHMVSSREEAAGAQMDFAGGVVVLPDLAHSRIFAKIFNPNTGEAPLREFRLVQPEEEKAESYATAAEVTALRNELSQLIAALNAPASGRHGTKGGNGDE